MTIEEQQFKKWLRRPTIFIANSWYLLAAAGQTLVGYLFVALAQFLSLFGLGMSQTTLTYAASTAFEVFVLALPVVWYAATHEGVDQSMRLNPPKLSMMLYAALSAYTGVIAVNDLSTWWMLLIEALGGSLYASGVPIPTNIDELTSSILLIGVIPGVCEELFFRGGLMGAWERRGTQQALIITSTLFALLHGSILGLPTQLIMGFVLGYVLILSDSLYVSMIYHTVHNTATLILAYLSAGMQAESAAISMTLAEQVVSGGGYVALAIQTLISGALFALSLYLMTNAQKKRGANPEKVSLTDGDKTPMTWQELLVLIAGLLTVGMAYLTDLLTIVGGI